MTELNESKSCAWIPKVEGFHSQTTIKENISPSFFTMAPLTDTNAMTAVFRMVLALSDVKILWGSLLFLKQVAGRVFKQRNQMSFKKKESKCQLKTFFSSQNRPLGIGRMNGSFDRTENRKKWKWGNMRMGPQKYFLCNDHRSVDLADYA